MKANSHKIELKANSLFHPQVNQKQIFSISNKNAGYAGITTARFIKIKKTLLELRSTFAYSRELDGHRLCVPILMCFSKNQLKVPIHLQKLLGNFADLRELMGQFLIRCDNLQKWIVQRFYKSRYTIFFTVDMTCSDLCIVKVVSMVDLDEIDVTLITAGHVNCSYVLTFFCFEIVQLQG